MGEEACSVRFVCRQTVIADDLPNTVWGCGSSRRCSAVSWIALVYVLLVQVVSASGGFYYSQVFSGKNTASGNADASSLSELDYKESGFSNGTVRQLTFLTTSEANRVNVQAFFVDAPGTFSQETYINVGYSCEDWGKQLLNQHLDLTGNRLFTNQTRRISMEAQMTRMNVTQLGQSRSTSLTLLK